MRKASFVLAITACAVSSLSLAQQRDPPADIASPAAVATTSEGSHDTGTERGKSGFGQIMSVLTGLLQDAAGKESVGVPSTGSRTLSSEESAVTITVTPVAGSSTFFVGKPSVRKSVRDRHAPGANTPPVQVTGTAVDTQAVALQAKGGAPD